MKSVRTKTIERLAGSIFLAAAILMGFSAVVDGALREWEACVLSAGVAAVAWAWGWILID